MKTKGHWPRGKRRNPEPPDWPRILAALEVAAERGQQSLIARKLEIDRATVFRWRHRGDYPERRHVQPLIDALYALKLYWVRTGRNSV